MKQQFADAEFHLEIALGAAYRQASDVGESLATADRIADGVADSWVNEWTATAELTQAAGAEAEAAGRRVSALSYYRRAATYYATALYRFSGATDHSPKRELELWRRQRACWERIVDLQPVPGERLSIPYEDTTLPGFFFRARCRARRAATAGRDEQRQRRRHLGDVVGRRSRRRRARLSLDDVRRSRAAGRAV
jgi:hypothetical protein